MRITKFGHACVRIEHDGQVVVVDPGAFTEPEAVDGATAVLLTHVHADHLHPANLRATDAPVWTIAEVAEGVRDQAPDVAERTTVIAPGDRFDIGVPVTAVGERHAVIHPSMPGVANSGYRMEVDGQTLFHPGDSFDHPEQGVDLLFLPVSAPWCKLAEVMDYAKAVGAPRSLAVHDRILSEVGLSLLDERVTAYLEGIGDYTRIADGSDLHA
ncbi:MBL fold metallo-hydrolase [Nocardioides mangrovicus]|uniref:MBL fold metallo-hydrolase n=1 Tax=Nocardioides mangrovicus TaxID=2478913 RepID=A0A3L8P569_9ACTN|nr:MBL fold metallo-hydrolase [Nocardioides mangrovicus]RLV50510.1 MBL fold metallo-hydrolase [Nocardioides mangrovicus]